MKEFNAFAAAKIALALASAGYEVDGEFATARVAEAAGSVTAYQADLAVDDAWKLSEARLLGARLEGTRPEFTRENENLISAATLYANGLRRAVTEPADGHPGYRHSSVLGCWVAEESAG